MLFLTIDVKCHIVPSVLPYIIFFLNPKFKKKISTAQRQIYFNLIIIFEIKCTIVSLFTQLNLYSKQTYRLFEK